MSWLSTLPGSCDPPPELDGGPATQVFLGAARAALGQAGEGLADVQEVLWAQVAFARSSPPCSSSKCQRVGGIAPSLPEMFQSLVNGYSPNRVVTRGT